MTAQATNPTSTRRSGRGLALWDNLFDPGEGRSDGALLRFRLLELFLLYATIGKAWSWGLYLTRIEDVVLRLGIANYLDPSWMFGAWPGPVNAALITALMLTGFFRLWRPAYLGAALLLIWQYSARYCLGEIPHSTNLAGTTLLALGVAFVAFPRAEDRIRFSWGATYFYAGVAYSLAAVSKLIGTGPHWPHGRHMQLWIHEKSVDAFSKFGEYELSTLQSIALEHQWVGTVTLGFGLLSEAAGFLMWWKRARLPVIAAIIGLHFGIFEMMGIFFQLNILQLTLMGLPIAIMADRRWSALEAAGDHGRAVGPLRAWMRRNP